MPDWYVFDERAETGPMGEDEAIAFLRTRAADFVLVRRADFDAWVPLGDVPELAAAVRSTGAVPATARGGAADAPAARGRPAPGGAKLLWAQIGALVGLSGCTAGLLLKWQGAALAAFDGVAHGFDQVCGTLVLTTLLGFIAGAIRDAVNETPRKKPRRANSRPWSLRVADVMARHWRGELPLWVSGWVFGVVGGIFISFMPAVTVAGVTAGRSYDPVLIFSSTVIVWVAVFAIAVWQVVGVWRSALHHAAAPPRCDQRGATDLAALWSALARLVVIVGLASLVASFATQWLPQLDELYKIAFYDDPDIPAYAIRVSRDGTETEITGGFKYGLADDFAAVARTAPHLKVVRLDSAGGRLGEGEKLFTLIRDLGLNTYVSSKCYSACTLAFAGGRARILRRGASLGFHKAEFPGVSENEFDSFQYRVFSAAGFDDAFIARALATPHRDLWTPSPDALLAARVVTAVVDAGRTGPPPPAGSAAGPGHVLAAK